jgi:hypothetical protein
MTDKQIAELRAQMLHELEDLDNKIAEQIDQKLDRVINDAIHTEKNLENRINDLERKIDDLERTLERKIEDVERSAQRQF